MRLNLGCGGQLAEGWCNIDRAATADISHDLTTPFPFADDSVDYAVAHHVIDLFTGTQLRDFLGECCRVIKPGGVLRVSVADIEAAIRAAERDDSQWFDMLGTDGTVLDRLALYVRLNGARTLTLTGPLIYHALQQAGFTPALKTPTACTDPAICDLDSRLLESVVVEGRK